MTTPLNPADAPAGYEARPVKVELSCDGCAFFAGRCLHVAGRCCGENRADGQDVVFVHRPTTPQESNQ